MIVRPVPSCPEGVATEILKSLYLYVWLYCAKVHLHEMENLILARNNPCLIPILVTIAHVVNVFIQNPGIIVPKDGASHTQC